MRIDPQIEALKDICIGTRRALHRIPETAFEEVKTQAYICSELGKLAPDGLDRLARTGVKAVWYAENAQETIAFRADMDGLNTFERSDKDYASTHAGKIHGCGHDGHMAMLLTLARMISANRDKLRCNVVLLFQPAEEGGGGAWRMIEEGALENPHIDRIYGIHIWPAVEKGKIGVRWGPMMAQTDEFDITVLGKSAHGASPQLGIDAVVVSAEIITMLQSVITRNVDPHQDALLTVGRITGGAARNIIADRVTMNATLRAMNENVSEELKQRIGDMVRGLSLATGAKVEIDELMHYPCLDNPRWMVENFYTHVDMADVSIVEPVLAADDFACYQKKTPGLYLFLGAGDGKTPPLHSENFDFDEGILLTGVEIYCRVLGIV